MLTLIIVPNFKGTAKQTAIAMLTCLALDCTYLIPIISH